MSRRSKRTRRSSAKSGGAAGFGIVVKNGLDQQRIRFDGTPYPMRRVGDSADLPLSAAYIRIGAEGELKAGVADGAAEFTFTFPERRRRSFPGVSRPASGSAVGPFAPALAKARPLTSSGCRSPKALHIAPLLVLGLVRTCHSRTRNTDIAYGRRLSEDMQVSSVGFRANKERYFPGDSFSLSRNSFSNFCCSGLSVSYYIVFISVYVYVFGGCFKCLCC